MDTIGDLIKTRRNAKGLTIRALAEQVDVSPSYISQIENNVKTKPQKLVLKALASGLDINYIDLLERAGYLYDEIEDEMGKLTEVEIKKIRDHQGLEAFGDLNTFKELYHEKQRALKHVTDIKDFLQCDYKKQISTIGASDYSPHYNGHKLTDEEREAILIFLQGYLNKYN